MIKDLEKKIDKKNDMIKDLEKKIHKLETDLTLHKEELASRGLSLNMAMEENTRFKQENELLHQNNLNLETQITNIQREPEPTLTNHQYNMMIGQEQGKITNLQRGQQHEDQDYNRRRIQDLRKTLDMYITRTSDMNQEIMDKNRIIQSHEDRIITMKAEVLKNKSHQTNQGPPISEEESLNWEIYKAQLDADHKKLKKILDDWEREPREGPNSSLGNPRTALERYTLYNQVGDTLKRVAKMENILKNGGSMEEMDQYDNQPLVMDLQDGILQPARNCMSPTSSSLEDDFTFCFVQMCKSVHYRELRKESKLKKGNNTEAAVLSIMQSEGLHNYQLQPVTSQTTEEDFSNMYK